MSGYATKSRLKKKRALRRKRKLIKALRSVFLISCAIVILIAAGFAIRSGKELSRSIKYPVEYSDFILKYSAENELDPYLVIAVIRQESNFIADAESPYAGGLMQLTPLTASEYGAKLGLESFDYMDPETNIRIGCYLLRALIDKYGGEVDTALAAYNGGPANVDEWLCNPQYSADGRRLTYIPFEETRSYVEKVNSYMDEYKNARALEEG